MRMAGTILWLNLLVIFSCGLENSRSAHERLLEDTLLKEYVHTFDELVTLTTSATMPEVVIDYSKPPQERFKDYYSELKNKKGESKKTLLGRLIIIQSKLKKKYVNTGLLTKSEMKRIVASEIKSRKS